MPVFTREQIVPEYTPEGSRWIVLLPEIGYVGDENGLLERNFEHAFPFPSRELAEQAAELAIAKHLESESNG